MPTFDETIAAPHNEAMRKPRFKRVRPTTPLNITPSMFEVLELIYQFKALRSHHIAMHLPHRHDKGLRHSLRLMFDHGLLDKRLCGLYENDTYLLTGKGSDALAGRDLPPRFLFLEGGFEVRLGSEFEHSMMTIDLLSNLVAGARAEGARPISAEEIFWGATSMEPFVLPRFTTYRERKTGVKKPYTLIADGMIGFEYPDQKRAFFTIEAEHNKANSRFDDDDPSSRQSSTRKKIAHYRDIDWRQVYSNLNIRNCRVMVAAPTPTQIKNKFQVARSVVKESHLFLGQAVPIVAGADVPILPGLFNAPWLRIGLPPERINSSTLRG
ncbi:MAG: hypothetical protein AAFY38_10385 [Pseudomonadota bacterium]